MKRFLTLLLFLAMTVSSFAGEITPNGISQGDLYQWLYNATTALNNGTLSDMGVTYASESLVITTGGAYKINGTIYTSTASNTLEFSSGHTALGNSEKCLFTINLDTSGDVVTLQSNIVAASADDPSPEYSASYAPIATLEVSTNSGATFTPNTTEMNASGVTSVFTDYAHMPISLTIPEGYR